MFQEGKKERKEEKQWEVKTGNGKERISRRKIVGGFRNMYSVNGRRTVDDFREDLDKRLNCEKL